LSQPSDPLELLVSVVPGGSEDAPLIPQRGPHWYLYVIGVSVAFVLLLGLLVLLLVRHRRRGEGRKPAVSAKVSEDRGLHGRSVPAATAQEESLYAVIKDTQPEEDTQLDSQVSSLCP